MTSSAITNTELCSWLRLLARAWSTKNFDIVEQLFHKCTKYVEAPFREPGRNVQDIIEIWREIEDHSDLDLAFDIIAISGRVAVVNYFATYSDRKQSQKSDGIYVIEFDDDGNCRTFRQWSVSIHED